MTFDVKVEASDIYAGGFIKVGLGRSSGGKDWNMTGLRASWG